jgi:hypothetical protein
MEQNAIVVSHTTIKRLQYFLHARLTPSSPFVTALLIANLAATAQLPSLLTSISERITSRSPNLVVDATTNLSMDRTS